MLDPDFVSQLILLVAAGGIGASVGSFLNVCVYRIPIGLTVGRPRRSFCPSCRHQVEIWDNVPILSWLWLRGKCRYCKSPISIWYFLVELFCGIGSALAFARGGLVGASSFLLLFSLLCIALRTRHSGYHPGILFVMALMCAAALVLLEHRITLTTAPLTILLCIIGGILIASHWTRLDRIDWQEALVVVCATLVCGGPISLVLAVVILAGSKFGNLSKRFPGLDDALLLAGVCIGPLVSF